jgi:hypothetical protein
MRFIFIPDFIAIPLPILLSGQVLVLINRSHVCRCYQVPQCLLHWRGTFPVRSDRRIRAAEPSQSLNPPASPNLSLHNVSERLLWLNLRHSPSLSSRDGRFHAHRQEQPVMSCIASNRSSPTAMPPRPYTRQEQQSSAVSRAQLNLCNPRWPSCPETSSPCRGTTTCSFPHPLQPLIKTCNVAATPSKPTASEFPPQPQPFPRICDVVAAWDGDGVKSRSQPPGQDTSSSL